MKICSSNSRSAFYFGCFTYYYSLCSYFFNCTNSNLFKLQGSTYLRGVNKYAVTFSYLAWVKIHYYFQFFIYHNQLLFNGSIHLRGIDKCAVTFGDLTRVKTLYYFHFFFIINQLLFNGSIHLRGIDKWQSRSTI